MAFEDMDTRAWYCRCGQRRNLGKLPRSFRSSYEQGGRGDAGKAVQGG
jgi:hypothetical protein